MELLCGILSLAPRPCPNRAGSDEPVPANSDGSKPELPPLSLGLSYRQLLMRHKLSVTGREALVREFKVA